MKKQQSITVLHIGEDYATIEVNGVEKEITKREGELIVKLIKNYK